MTASINEAIKRGEEMGNAVAREVPVFLTFQPMVNSECGRLILRCHRVAYREQDHLPGWGNLLSILRTGKFDLPVLYGNGLKISTPRAMVEYFDAAAPAERRLIPVAEPQKSEVEADWALFNGGMGAWTAQFAYYHLLQDRPLMSRLFAAPLAGTEAKLTRPLYPLVRTVIGLGVKLSPEQSQAALDLIRGAYDKAEKKIADGRPFLAGDRLTLADLALASSSAALLLPRGYDAVMPTIAEMPAALRAGVEELRARPIAPFVQHIYDSLPPPTAVAA